MPFPKLEARKFASIRELNGISARTMEEHYELYKGYVAKTNEIQEKLNTTDRGTANQNHEIYFGHLGGKGGMPTGRVMDGIKRDFPSYDAWLADFKASGLAARGWVWLAHDHDWNTLTTVIGDAQNTFPLWNATPILALDVYEHAYWIDYGRARAKYIEAFFSNLDWSVVEQNLERALAQTVHK